ncbi:MAG: drug resistance transporter, EmrB/QacA subfamily, partial [Conexibacter sp.]|nr:drug resistance transporter, EmrB/QacA subfamily [Conexibacter sp.]
ARAPLAPLRIFRLRSVALANATQVLLIAGAFGQQFLVALYLKGVRGYDPIAIGLATLPTAVVIGVVALVASGPVMARIGARATLLAGLALTALAFAWLARLPAGASYATDLLPALLGMGMGFGLASPALTTLAMTGVAPADAGLASGLVNTTQQLGAALGLAILATLATTRTAHLAGAGTAHAEALAAGYRLAFAVAAGFVVAALALAALVRGERRGATASEPCPSPSPS